MEIISEDVVAGVVSRRFDLTVEGLTVPGVHWWPEAGSGPRPIVLIGHGGFQSKTAPNIVELAAQLALERGYGSIALDAPHHGARRTEADIARHDEILRRIEAAGGVLPKLPARGSSDDPSNEPVDEGDREPRMVREWKALLDELEAGPEEAGSSYGYWGVSMGTRFGVPLVATEPRISAAVFGLYGLGGPDDPFRPVAEAVTVPVLFLFQHDDELMTPEAGLELWRAFGSTHKTMHVNPGPHVGVPRFERDSTSAFFARHLT